MKIQSLKKSNQKQRFLKTLKNYLISTKGKDENQMIYQLLTISHPYLAIVFANTKQHVKLPIT